MGCFYTNILPVMFFISSPSVRDQVPEGIKVYKRKKFRGSMGKQNSEVGLNLVGPIMKLTC